MKKITISLLFVFLLFTVGCKKEEDLYKDYIEVKQFCDYVMETNVYTSVDSETAYQVLDEQYGQYIQGGGCTAVGKWSTYDGMIVGRNMDLYVTDKPCYIVKTNEEGFKKTFGLMYSPWKGESWLEVKEHGVNPELYNLIPFMQTDVMNEDGFYIEINMRNATYNALGESVFSCNGTNPGKTRLLAFVLPEYLGKRCSTVEEAVRICKEELDLYTPNPSLGNIDWNFCFMVSDATGHYGVIEIAQNTVNFIDATDSYLEEEMPLGSCQANYYLTPEFAELEKMRCGLGRVDYVGRHWNSITCEENMYTTMLGITYYQVYSSYCQFDNLTEFVGYYEEDGINFKGSVTPDVVDGEIVVWDYDYVTNPANREAVENYIKWCEGRLTTRKSDGTVESSSAYWSSIFTLVANSTNKTMFVRFNENARSIIFFKFSDWE